MHKIVIKFAMYIVALATTKHFVNQISFSVVSMHDTLMLQHLVH